MSFNFRNRHMFNTNSLKHTTARGLRIHCIALCIVGLIHTVLYCTVLYCTSCTVLYCTVLYCTVLYCTVLYILKVNFQRSLMACRANIPGFFYPNAELWHNLHKTCTIFLPILENSHTYQLTHSNVKYLNHNTWPAYTQPLPTTKWTAEVRGSLR